MLVRTYHGRQIVSVEHTPVVARGEKPPQCDGWKHTVDGLGEFLTLADAIAAVRAAGKTEPDYTADGWESAQEGEA